MHQNICVLEMTSLKKTQQYNTKHTAFLTDLYLLLPSLLFLLCCFLLISYFLSFPLISFPFLFFSFVRFTSLFSMLSFFSCCLISSSFLRFFFLWFTSHLHCSLLFLFLPSCSLLFLILHVLACFLSPCRVLFLAGPDIYSSSY